MHVLIVGARGQLWQALVAAYRAQVDCRLTLWNRPNYDIATPTICDAVAALCPDVLINAAAWTQVDAAEQEPV
ncbi:MAG: sugar nucleotide-binding protein, partial [Caldilineaceae bacterium]|nr:sugar nucleotide-binding protein [Caldilineaceae bacterium]